MEEQLFKQKVAKAMRTHTVPEILENHGIEVIHGRCKSICHSGTKLTSKVSDDACYCFRCNKAFNVITLTQELDGCTFLEAVEKLAGNELTAEDVKAEKEAMTRAKKQKLAKESFDRKYKAWLQLKGFYKDLMDAAPDLTEEFAHWYSLYRAADSELEELLLKAPAGI